MLELRHYKRLNQKMLKLFSKMPNQKRIWVNSWIIKKFYSLRHRLLQLNYHNSLTSLQLKYKNQPCLPSNLLTTIFKMLLTHFLSNRRTHWPVRRKKVHYCKQALKPNRKCLLMISISTTPTQIKTRYRLLLKHLNRPRYSKRPRQKLDCSIKGKCLQILLTQLKTNKLIIKVYSQHSLKLFKLKACKVKTWCLTTQLPLRNLRNKLKT